MPQITTSAPSLLLIGMTSPTGWQVLHCLTRSGVRMRVLVRTRADAAALQAVGIEAIVGDLVLPHTLDRAFCGIEKILFLAEEEPQQVARQSNLLWAARRAGVSHIVQLVAHWQGQEPATTLGQRSLAVESQVEASDITWTHLQAHFFMQNFLHWAPTISTRRVFYAPMLATPVSMVDVRDVAAVAAQVLTQAEHAGKVHIITGPQALSFGEAAHQLDIALGQPVIYVDVPLDAARETMLQAGVTPWFAEALVGLWGALRQGAQSCVTDVVRTVGQTEAHSFAQWAQDYAPVFRRNGGAGPTPIL